MKRILQMDVVATSGMTLFSYIVSFMCREKFLETELLNQFIFFNRNKKKKNNPAGFVIHYAVGTFFAVIYYKLWERTSLRPQSSSSFALGLVNGLIGIFGWHLFFKLHPNPPEIKPAKYYTQLLGAHIVFGWLNGLVFRNSHRIR